MIVVPVCCNYQLDRCRWVYANAAEVLDWSWPLRGLINARIDDHPLMMPKVHKHTFAVTRAKDGYLYLVVLGRTA